MELLLSVGLAGRHALGSANAKELSGVVWNIVSATDAEAASGAIEIRLARAVIRIEGAVDATTLRTVLDRLTP